MKTYLRIVVVGLALSIDPVSAHAQTFAFVYPEEMTMPIRLTHTPTTCWMYPVARIKRGIGRRFGPACDSQQ